MIVKQMVRIVDSGDTEMLEGRHRSGQATYAVSRSLSRHGRTRSILDCGNCCLAAVAGRLGTAWRFNLYNL